MESGDLGPFLNPRAGEDILRYIRGRRLTGIPVLVFCGASLRETHYVWSFGLAGSTAVGQVVRRYIKGLYLGVDDSQSWATYKAK